MMKIGLSFIIQISEIYILNAHSIINFIFLCKNLMYLSTKKNKKKLISQKDGFSTLQVVRYQFLPRIKQAVHSLLGLLVTSRGSR